MESNSNLNGENKTEVSTGLCPVCHQSVLSQYYFCPNCGTKLASAPLSTSIITQLGIYLHSIILPMLLFISISHWKGLKYSRSSDVKVKWIGLIAWMLLIISTIVTFWLVWYSYILLQQSIQTSMDSLNLDLNSLNL
jgi:hypothetical protein